MTFMKDESSANSVFAGLPVSLRVIDILCIASLARTAEIIDSLIVHVHNPLPACVTPLLSQGNDVIDIDGSAASVHPSSAAAKPHGCGKSFCCAVPFFKESAAVCINSEMNYSFTHGFVTFRTFPEESGFLCSGKPEPHPCSFPGISQRPQFSYSRRRHRRKSPTAP